MLSLPQFGGRSRRDYSLRSSASAAAKITSRFIQERRRPPRDVTRFEDRRGDSPRSSESAKACSIDGVSASRPSSQAAHKSAKVSAKRSSVFAASCASSGGELVAKESRRPHAERVDDLGFPAEENAAGGTNAWRVGRGTPPGFMGPRRVSALQLKEASRALHSMMRGKVVAGNPARPNTRSKPEADTPFPRLVKSPITPRRSLSI